MRVLLVEDDTSVAGSIVTMLRSEGFVVDTTDLGEDGLEIGKIYDYDIILLDLMLPDIDGYEVLHRLRAAKVDTPILILSGLTDMQHKVKGLGIGADDYLTKPFHKSELVARIQAIIGVQKDIPSRLSRPADCRSTWIRVPWRSMGSQYISPARNMRFSSFLLFVKERP